MKHTYKLVRDKTPALCKKYGLKRTECSLTDKVVEGAALEQLLRIKLLEESIEVLASKDSDNLIEEMADVLEVLYALAFVNDIQIKTIQEVRVQKLRDKGGFLEGKLIELQGNPYDIEPFPLEDYVTED